MNILAVDYGEKEVGLAFAPEDVRIAMPFGTVERVDDAQLVARLQQLIEKERIRTVVVGMPLMLDDRESAQTHRTKVFVEALRAAVSCDVVTFPEALTSREAAERPHGSGASIHERSAMILLEDWLEMHPR